jgi:hypothetical protein
VHHFIDKGKGITIKLPLTEDELSQHQNQIQQRELDNSVQVIISTEHLRNLEIDRTINEENLSTNLETERKKQSGELTREQTEARWRRHQQRSSLVTAQPLVPIEEDDNSGILEQCSQGDENEEEENEGGVRNDAPLIAQRQTSARTTAVADLLITASSLAAAAAIRRATAVDDKEKDQGQTCGCKRDRELDELPADNDLIRLQLAYDAAQQEATMSERKRVLASDLLHACRMKRSYPNDKKARKSPAQHMLPSNEDDMIIADDQTHIDIIDEQMMVLRAKFICQFVTDLLYISML